MKLAIVMFAVASATNAATLPGMNTAVHSVPRLADLTASMTTEAASLDAARWIRCLVRSKGDVMAAAMHFAAVYPAAMHKTFIVQKAAVLPGTTTDATWAGPLAPHTPLTDALVQFARAQSVLGQLPTMPVPLNVSVAVMTGTVVGSWAGEGTPKPLGAQASVRVTVDPAKVSAQIPITLELARVISPEADQTVRDDLVAALAQAVDTRLLDQTQGHTPGGGPASILFGIAPLAPSGVDAAAAVKDFEKVLAAFFAANPNAGRARVLVPQNTDALIRSVRPVDPYLGREAIVSDNVGNRIVCVNAAQLLVADTGAELDATRNATYQSDTAPDNPATAATVLVSAWQNNEVIVRAERFVSWALAKSSAVTWCGPTAYSF